MNFYYITGTSSGIGKALAVQLLENPLNKVIGISRHCTIKHSNYKHLGLDLSKPESLINFKFSGHAKAIKIVLINNAGTLGSIKPVGKQKASTIIENYTLNLLAPSVLMNAFINCFEDSDAEKLILNISSGAGKAPVDGWSVYCSSKAGLDMYSQVLDVEQKIQGAPNPFKIFSIAPGVVDTKMQGEIRKASKSNFSRLDYFVKLKESQQLSDPEVIAKKYLDLLNNPNKINAVLDSLRNH